MAINIMKKFFFIFVFSLFVFEKSSAATGEGQPTQYQVTMKKVELCTDLACTSPYVLGEKDMEADIVPTEGGTNVGNYAPTTGIPPGKVFTHLRVTISRTFTVTANISTSGASCKTDGGNNATATQMTLGLKNGLADAVPETMFLNDEGEYNPANGTKAGGGAIDVDYSDPESAKAMTVSGDTAVMTYELVSPYQKTLRAPIIKVKFNTATAIGVDDTACAMFINEPTVTIALD